MNKKKKNIELRIYELLGIKTFRKILFKLAYILIIPITLKMTKEERYKFIYNTPSNYNMKKGHGIQDLRDFKKKLLYNASVHIISLIALIPSLLEAIGNTASLSTIIITLFFLPINIYCIMLQRYNQIRINQVIMRGEQLEEAKKNKLKGELIKEDLLLSEHTYKIINQHDKEKSISFEELLKTATYEQLKKYRDYLSYFKRLNQLKEEYPRYYDQYEHISVPLQKNTRLKLELKPQKQNKNSN